MITAKRRLTVTPKAALVAVGAVVLVVAWLFAFYLPQSRKLTALDAKRSSLQTTVATLEARLQRVKKEAQHVTQIRGMYSRLEGYVPAAEELYTYIHTIAKAGRAAGVSVTSLQPDPLAPASGTSYSSIAIAASVKGTYDQLLAFVKNLYNLPRLTDINALSISGGGPGSSRETKLSASLQLAIFTSQKPEIVP